MRVTLDLPISKVEALVEMGFVELKSHLKRYDDAKQNILNALNNMIEMMNSLKPEDINKEMLLSLIDNANSVVTEETNEIFWHSEKKASDFLIEISNLSLVLLKDDDAKKEPMLNKINSNLNYIIERFNNVFSVNLSEVKRVE